MAPQPAPHSGQFLVMIALVQSVIYAVIWLWNEYVASYITLIFPAVLLVVLILSKMADWIEPSRIPLWYYKVMIISIFTPIIIAAVFYFIYEGRIDWLKDL